jgi:hypothetical protein
MVGAVLERVLVDEVIEVVCYRIGHLRWSTGAGTIGETLEPVLSEAMDPCAEGRIRKVECV